MRKFFLAALLIALVFPATPAHAAPGSPWVHDQESQTNDQEVKSVTSRCPDGEVLYGMGGWTQPGGQILTSIAPSADLSTLVVWARTAKPGSGEVWSVWARIVCGPPGPYRKLGLGTTSATAQCNDDDIVIGTGFAIPQASSQTYITSVVPSGWLDELTVTAAGTTGAMGVTSFAICHTWGDDITGRVAASPLDSSPSKVISPGFTAQPGLDAAIFGGGVRVRGTGAFVDGFTPGAGLDKFWARAARPLPQGMQSMALVPPDAWDTDGVAICIGHWYVLPA